MDEMRAFMSDRGYSINTNPRRELDIMMEYTLYLAQKKENGETLTRGQSHFLLISYRLVKFVQDKLREQPSISES